MIQSATASTRAQFYSQGRPAYPELLFTVMAQFFKAQESIIDLGCGNGRGSIPLSKKCPNAAIIGLDPDKEMLEECRAQGAGFPCHVGKVSDLSKLFPAACFTSAVAFSALSLFQDEKSITAIHEALMPEGLFFDVGDEVVNNDPIGDLMCEVVRQSLDIEIKKRAATQEHNSLISCGFAFIEKHEVTVVEQYDYERTLANMKSRMNYPKLTLAQDQKVQECLQQHFKSDSALPIKVKYYVSVYRRV